MDTQSEDDLFILKAGEFEILYLACHGSELGTDPKEAGLELGKPFQLVKLPTIRSLNLKRCRLAVIQACWTGWMEHVREFPVQGFPQAFLDAGAAAIVAPMLPVPDPFCPIFTAVFCRVLRFRQGAEALGYTLGVLRWHGERLTATEPQAARLWNLGWTFDSYEYRFAGDPAIDLTGGRLRRLLSWLSFQFWLGKRLLGARFATSPLRAEAVAGREQPSG